VVVVLARARDDVNSLPPTARDRPRVRRGRDVDSFRSPP
jgi:hypothetical protein